MLGTSHSYVPNGWVPVRSMLSNHSLAPLKGVSAISREIQASSRIVPRHRFALLDFTGKMGMVVPEEGNQGGNFLGADGELSVQVTTVDLFCEESGSHCGCDQH